MDFDDKLLGGDAASLLHAPLDGDAGDDDGAEIVVYATRWWILLQYTGVALLQG